MLIGEIAALGLLVLAATAGGFIAKFFRMPPLLGMLVAGIIVRNAPGEPLAELPDDISVGLRLAALTVILLRAGLGLDLEALVRLKGSLVRLAFLPNLSEAATVAGVAVLLLELPPAWGLLLGFVVAAVSPAVVVPSLIELQSEGYGVKKGIPTMVLAAASFDDVLSITGFGAMLSIVFAGQGEGSVAGSLVRAPIELLLGIGVGVIAGLACGALAKAPAALRFAALAGLGFAAVLAGWAVGFAGGGSLATMTMGAVAGRAWGASAAPVAMIASRVWAVAQPVLFGLIGAAVALTAIESSYIVRGLVVLAIGLAVRIAVTYASVSPDRFTTDERRFVALAWIPKATVQAAIGALALDLARQYESGALIESYGIQVVTIAVLAIIVTAPIGALVIARTGPRWLTRDDA